MRGFYFLMIFILVYPVCEAASSVNFKQIIQRYVQNSGVKMNFKKSTYLKLLKKTKVSKGEILMSRGSIALKVEDNLKTRIISDRNYLWYITSPSGEQKQTVKIDLKNIAGKNKAFLSLLFSPELLFQEFHFVSSRPKGRTWILDFKPVKNDSEIQSFSVKVDGRLILKAWLKWKNLGNEEEYTFFNIRFNQKITSENFRI